VSNISILLQNHHQTNYSYNIYIVLYTSWQGMMTSNGSNIKGNGIVVMKRSDYLSSVTSLL
jgi:hypothetical protein